MPAWFRHRPSPCAAGAVRWRRSRGARRGATAVEFAVLAVPATLLILALAEGAWQAGTLAALDHAARSAARSGALGCSDASTARFASAASGGFLSEDRFQEVPSGIGRPGEVVSYAWAYSQRWLAGPLMTRLTGNAAMTHRARLTVRNEPYAAAQDACLPSPPAAAGRS
jgi:Flp pilus assembly protein TadG